MISTICYPHKMEIGRYIIINLVIAFGITLYFCAECYISWEGVKSISPDLLYSFVISLSLSYGISRLEDYNTRLVSWLESPFKRLLLEIVVVSVYSFGICTIIIVSFGWIFGRFGLTDIPWAYIFKNVKFSVMIAYVITAFFTSRAFLMEWKQAAVDAEKLKAEQYAGKYRTLKEQLNPHFLFNSLNVLSNIVYEDQDKAAEYIQQLSRFYRYVLEVQHEELVAAENELEFGKRYLFLQKLRFGDKLRVKIETGVAKDMLLPPLSIQLLLENAIKHNEVSNDNPLNVSISVLRDHLLVVNNINPKMSQDEESTGVGLKNINERYRLLSGKEVIVYNDGSEFRVELPMLKLEDRL